MINFNLVIKKANCAKRIISNIGLRQPTMFYNVNKRSLYNKKEDLEEFGKLFFMEIYFRKTK